MSNSKKDKERERLSGRVFVQGDSIVWVSEKGEELTRISAKNIKIIGEITTNDGPVADDWYYIFVLDSNDIRQISAYAINIEVALTDFGKIFKTDIGGQLASSAYWKSIVLWPTMFRGQELFKIVNIQPINLWQRIKTKVGFGREQIELTDELQTYLSSRVSR
jgi:hypothetical protein